MSRPTQTDLTETLKALGDKSRWQICQILLEKETCVGEIVARLGISQPLVSHHLKALRRAGLVKTRRQGNWIFYSLVPERFNEVIGQLAQDFGSLTEAAAAYDA